MSNAAGGERSFRTKMTTDVAITGHTYEPAKIEPTDERVSGLKLPDGFRVSKFAALSNPRMIAVAADGTIYVTQREPGTLTMLRDTDNDGVADVQKVVAEKKMLHGLTIHNGKMYLITVKEVLVADIKPDGTLTAPRTIISDLPDGGQHPNRTLAVGSDGMRLARRQRSERRTQRDYGGHEVWLALRLRRQQNKSARRCAPEIRIDERRLGAAEQRAVATLHGAQRADGDGFLYRHDVS